MDFLITILTLSIVIFVHELGHYYAAKKCGVGVLEFSIGMGPKLIGINRNKTLYSLRLLPFGGFVKLEGFDETADKSSVSSYKNKSISQRAFIISAGSIMNLIFAFLLYVFFVFVQGAPSISTTVDTIMNDAPAYNAGILVGDNVLSVDGVSLDNNGQMLIKKVQDSKGSPIAIRVQRKNEILSLLVTPELSEGKYIFGVILETQFSSITVIEGISKSIKIFSEQIRMVFKSLGMLISGKANLADLTGPVGIVQFAAFQLDKSVIGFLNIIAMISISLGIINLFPFPVLDGGHLFFLGIEGLIKRPIPDKALSIIGNVSAMFLIALMAIIVLNDIRFWQDRQQLFDSLFG
jgi:regulator of sigma E protease